MLSRHFDLHTQTSHLSASIHKKAGKARGVTRSHLVNVPPVARVVVASPDDVELSQHRSHAVPRPPHWAICQHVPAVCPGVIALQLLQIVLSSPPTRDVHLPIQRCSRVRVHLQRRAKGKAKCSGRVYGFLPVLKQGIDMKRGTFFISYAEIKNRKDFLMDSSFLDTIIVNF